MIPQILTFILDDNPDIEIIIKAILKKEGLYDIHGFTTLESFLQALSKEVNLVLLDIELNDKNYNIFELIKLIQKDFTGIHIIVISGYLNEDVKYKLWQSEVFFAIDKNGNTFEKELKETLDRLLPRIQLKNNALQS